MALTAITAGLLPSANILARGISALLRLSLVLSTWNAPLPVLHAHEVNGIANTSQSRALWQHVLEYHEDAAVAGTSYLGWHVHWLLPSEWQSFPCHRHTNCPGDHSSDHDNSMLCSGTAVPAKTAAHVSAPDVGKPLWLLDVAGTSDNWLSPSQLIREDRFAPLHFLGSYQGSTSLSELLGVWRC